MQLFVTKEKYYPLSEEQGKKRLCFCCHSCGLEDNASIKASGKKGNILKVKEYFRVDKPEVIFNTGVSVMVLYCMRKLHSSP